MGIRFFENSGLIYAGKKMYEIRDAVKTDSRTATGTLLNHYQVVANALSRLPQPISRNQQIRGQLKPR
jgi:hypothetical protein